MNVTALQIAQRFLGVKEVSGPMSNPLVLAMLQLDTAWVQDDETPWCSGFPNFVCWLLPGVPRSRSLAARSWLLVGRSVPLVEAVPGWDLVVLSRGPLPQPPASVLAANGHVGFYVGQDATTVQLLGGNQGNAVSIASFKKSRVLRVCRILP